MLQAARERERDNSPQIPDGRGGGGGETLDEDSEGWSDITQVYSNNNRCIYIYFKEKTTLMNGDKQVSDAYICVYRLNLYSLGWCYWCCCWGRDYP